ncbi:MAG: SDR family oxidoreductase [Chloroflexia bacterium]|nr:SDR family oxidoreductase [Chloroflexia bacterium]
MTGSQGDAVPARESAASGAVGARLRGKTALVTGSTRGIGRTIAEWLAREGADVVVTGREPAAVAEATAAIEALGVKSLGIAADLAQVSEAHRLASETLARVDHLDLLVNNAGMSLRGPFWEVTDAAWEEQINVNLRSSFILAQYAARQMRERGIRGRIVNTSTVGAHRCHRDATVYDSAKGAVEVMTRNMAFELGPDGISVNCVIPGPIAERPGRPESIDGWAKAVANVPVGRLGRSDDVAAAVLFFCLDETSFTTGQSLLIDGGYAAALDE